MPPALTVILPAAAAHPRGPAPTPRSLLRVGRRTLLAAQVAAVRAARPDADVVLVAGHGWERVRAAVPPGVRVVRNERHADTGSGHSVGLALRASRADRYLVVYGDLLFTPKLVADALVRPGPVLVLGGRGDLGVAHAGAAASRVDYGLPSRWCQVFALGPAEAAAFVRSAERPGGERWAAHEHLNAAMDAGAAFGVVRTSDPPRELDTARDFREHGVTCG
jgi:hypothetical protein